MNITIRRIPFNGFLTMGSPFFQSTEQVTACINGQETENKNDEANEVDHDYAAAPIFSEYREA